jgi:hypothetical protein
MARDNDNYKEGKDFTWVDMKDSKGNIVKDGFGKAVKTRKFGVKAEAPAAAPKAKTKAASKPTSSAPTKSIRPKAKPAAASKPTTGLTDSQRTSLREVGLTGVGLTDRQSKYMTTNTKPKSAVSGASRSADNKVKPKGRTPVPGMAIVTAIKNAFTGNGATDAAKISSSGNINLGRKPKPEGAKVPAGAPNRADVIKKKKK